MRVTRYSWLALALAPALIGGMAFGQPKPVEIDIKDFDFAPMSVTVSAGDEVVWKNLDGEVHTVVSLDGAFRSMALDQGDSFTFRFTKPGTYAYLCSVHSQMRATVIVK